MYFLYFLLTNPILVDIGYPADNLQFIAILTNYSFTNYNNNYPFSPWSFLSLPMVSVMHVTPCVPSCLGLDTRDHHLLSPPPPATTSSPWCAILLHAVGLARPMETSYISAPKLDCKKHSRQSPLLSWGGGSFISRIPWSYFPIAYGQKKNYCN